MDISRILAIKGKGVVTVLPDQTVREALSLFADRNIGSLVVVDLSDHIVGIITERDIIRAMVRDETVFAYSVGELMTRDVITAMPEDDLNSVANTMTEKRIRHLPVVKDSRLIGIVSIGDIVKAQRDAYLGEVDTLQTQLIEGEG
ncbi:MAG: CBS domain-containing protein [Anaerolineales bacterium]|nr:CBS domain-containing protein [Anaerolineales bacterium]